MLTTLYFGMTGAFSGPPLATLLESSVSVRAIVMPALAGTVAGDDPPYRVLPAASVSAVRRPLPLFAPALGPTILDLAARHALPVIEIARFRDPATCDLLAGYAPDAICVACFSRRLPADVLRLPRLGCLNLHPSLLPRNRGPDPLFWTFRNGDAQTGVTIHFMDEGLDTGPILRQTIIPVPDGITEAALERACAEAGARLLLESLRDLDAGTAHPVAQEPTLSTTYPWPRPADFIITPDRSARWAFNFARALAGRPQPIAILAPGERLRLLTPLGFDEAATLDADVVREGDELWLRCSPGIFHARAAPWDET